MRPAPFALERYFAAHEFSTDLVLCASDCESMTIGDLLALEPGSEEAFRTHWLGYTESAGDPALREAVAAIYETVSPGDVLVHSGAEEAIHSFVHGVLEAGDHIVVHTPCYQSLHEVARALGAEVSPWRARPEDGWALDPDDLRAAIRPNTRAVVINCPHNPSGYLMDGERFRAVIEIADRHGLILFSDEVYRELEHEPADRLPAACDLYERGVSLGVLSKSYGLPGLRIGWVATHDAAVRGAMAAMKDYTTICNAAPSEFLARIALAHRHDLAARSRTLVLENLGLLDDFFARHAGRFEWRRPRAGPVAFPALRAGGADTFCERLRREAGVLLLPGSVYDAACEAHFRIGFGRRHMAQALDRLEAFLGTGTGP